MNKKQRSHQAYLKAKANYHKRVIPKMKTCVHCGRRRSSKRFSKSPSNRDGLQSWCNLCVAVRAGKWGRDNRGRVRELGRKRRLHNLAVTRARSRDWYKENRIAILRKEQDRRRKDKLRLQASARVSSALESGKIRRPKKCSVCHRKCKPDAHHDSYEPSQQLKVKWLCPPCHKRWHFDMKREGRSS